MSNLHNSWQPQPSTANWIHLWNNTPLQPPSSIYLAAWYKDKTTGQVRDSALWKKCCNGSKIKLIFYSSRAVPLRKLFHRVVSKKVTKKHFLCTFCVQQCRIPQHIHVLSNTYLTYWRPIYFIKIKVTHVIRNGPEVVIVKWTRGHRQDYLLQSLIFCSSLFALLTCSWLKPLKSLLCIQRNEPNIIKPAFTCLQCELNRLLTLDPQCCIKNN